MRIHDYAPLNLLRRFLPSDGSSAMFIHQCYSREVWRRRGIRVGLDLLLGFLVWPLITLGSVSWFIQRNGSAIKARTGKGVVRQSFEQLYLAIVHAIPPRWYYMFELHDDDKRRQAGQYLHRFETKGGIYTILKEKTTTGAPLSPLADKVAFALWCHEHNVPAVPVMIVLKGGTVTSCSGSTPTLPKIDLFVKPTQGKGGCGAERWDYQPPDFYQGTDGSLLTEAELLDHLKTLSREQGYLVQPRAVNHPLIADLSNGALITMRIMTCRNEQGGVEVTNAVLRMARGLNTVVDNFHAGGIAAKVDLRTGELGRASDRGVRTAIGWCDTHPDTGARIFGRRLPLWGETLALVQRAHAVFSDRIIVGWDVALLKDGLQLVEGNGAPDLDIIQRTHREPLGNARLGQLLAFHLEQVRQGDNHMTKRHAVANTQSSKRVEPGV
jgi:hypothetical protein